MGQRYFLRQPEDQQPFRPQQHRPVAARALQHQAKAQTEGKEQHREVRARHHVQADAPQAEPRGGEDKEAADDREQSRE
jgi:hypothetical protein